LPTNIAFVTLPGKERINSIADAKAKNLRVGVNLETPWHKFLVKNGYENIDVVTNEEFNAKKLLAGRIDAWYVPADRGFYYLKKRGLQKRPVVGESLQKGELWLAANPGFPPVTAMKLQKAIEEVQGGEVYEKLYNKYFCFSQ